MAQLVALMSGVMLGGVAEVVGSNLARGKIFTAYIYIYIYLLGAVVAFLIGNIAHF